MVKQLHCARLGVARSGGTKERTNASEPMGPSDGAPSSRFDVSPVCRVRVCTCVCVGRGRGRVCFMSLVSFPPALVVCQWHPVWCEFARLWSESDSRGSRRRRFGQGCAHEKASGRPGGGGCRTRLYIKNNRKNRRSDRERDTAQATSSWWVSRRSEFVQSSGISGPHGRRG